MGTRVKRCQGTTGSSVEGGDWGGGEAHLVEEPIPSSRAWFDVVVQDMVQLYPTCTL